MAFWASINNKHEDFKYVISSPYLSAELRRKRNVRSRYHRIQFITPGHATGKRERERERERDFEFEFEFEFCTSVQRSLTLSGITSFLLAKNLPLLCTVTG